MGLLDRRIQWLRPGVMHDSQLVPEILDPFTPLVHVLGGGILASSLERPPPISVGAL